MNAASEHLSAEFILRASIPLDLTPANVNKASIAMDRIVLVRTSKFVHVHRSNLKEANTMILDSSGLVKLVLSNNTL